MFALEPGEKHSLVEGRLPYEHIDTVKLVTNSGFFFCHS